MNVTVQRCEMALHPAKPHLHTRITERPGMVRWIDISRVTESNALRTGRVLPGVFGRVGVGTPCGVPESVEHLNNPSQVVTPTEREKKTVETITDLYPLSTTKLGQHPLGTRLTIRTRPVGELRDGAVAFGCQTFDPAALLREGGTIESTPTGLRVTADARIITQNGVRWVEPLAGDRRISNADLNEYAESVTVQPPTDADLSRRMHEAWGRASGIEAGMRDALAVYVESEGDPLLAKIVAVYVAGTGDSRSKMSDVLTVIREVHGR